jgi:5-(carboxyamino)imidazole ribonucleotide mutase
VSKVAILMGSGSDRQVMSKAAETLDSFGVPHEMRVLSAHKTPDEAFAFAAAAEASGFSVIIAGAGKAAHLAGVMAAKTVLPVIGVPLSASLDGLDSLLATAQMPTGVPVATVAIDGATNAALLAVEIMAVSDPDLREKLVAYRKRLAVETLNA